MKVTIALITLLLSVHAFADKKKPTNAEKEMADRNGNASVLVGSGASYEGSNIKDTRPLDVKKKK